MIKQLEKDIYSNNWERSLKAADKLAEIKSDNSIKILMNALSSNNNFTRNAAALGIRELNSRNAFDALYHRILDLGPNEEIGTLIYGLESSDCSNYLIELIDFFFHGNFEVKHSIKIIFDKQVNALSSENKKLLSKKLKSYKMTITDFKKLKY